jgi:hypothetical protein
MKKLEIDVYALNPDSIILKAVTDIDAVWAAEGILSKPIYNEADTLEVRYRNKTLYTVSKIGGKVKSEKTKYYKEWLNKR